jgi:predicted amidophosphoribosyltransferase
VAAIHPIKLAGVWHQGYALDRHTISSTYLGLDQSGNDIYDTKRSEIGELLFRYKYRNDASVLPEIAAAAAKFIQQDWKITDVIQAIVAVPPSNMARRTQPVMMLARDISQILGVPVLENAVIKAKATPQLKNVRDYQECTSLLKDAFVVDSSKVRGLSVLLFDDLFQSGATQNAITEALYKKGNVEQVFVLTVTKTRSEQ